MGDDSQITAWAVVLLALAVMLSIPASTAAPALSELGERTTEDAARAAADQAWAPNPETVDEALTESLGQLGIHAEPASAETSDLETAVATYLKATGEDPTPVLGWQAPAMDEDLESALAHVVSLQAQAVVHEGPDWMAWLQDLKVAYDAGDSEAFQRLLGTLPGEDLEILQDKAPEIRGLAIAVDHLVEELDEKDPPVFEDPTGMVVRVSGDTDDTHEDVFAPVLLVDLGGDDTYTGTHGCNGVVVDLGGDDTYLGLCGQGAGVLVPGTAPVGIHVDLAGDDQYAAVAGQGSGLGGAGVLLDAGGEDRQLGLLLSQGGAALGIGALVRGDGGGTLAALTASQGFGLAGAGLVTGGTGDDLYAMLSVAEIIVPLIGQGAAASAAIPGLGLVTPQELPDTEELPAGAGALTDAGGNDTYAMLALTIGELSALGQGYGADAGQGSLSDAGGSDTLALLSIGLEFAVGGTDTDLPEGSGGDAGAVLAGQGVGENEGVGVLSLAGDTEDENALHVAGLAGSLGVGFGEPGIAGDAVTTALAQGAGSLGGTGVLIGSPGQDIYSVQANALAAALALDLDFAFDLDLDVGFDLCNDFDFATGQIAAAFASCEADALAQSFSAAETHARAVAGAGDAVAKAHAQGFGTENGIGALIDGGGTDIYEVQTTAVPAALAFAESMALSLAVSLSTSLAAAEAIALAFDSDVSFGQFANAFSTAGALSMAITQSISTASAEATASAVSEAEATVGDGIAESLGQGYGAINGQGALLDARGPDYTALEANSRPLSASAALSQAFAGAAALALSASLSFAEAGAGSFSLATAADADFDADVDFDGATGFCSTINWFCTAFASAFSTSFASAFAVSAAAAESLALSGAGAQALAVSIAEALASASSSAATATSHGAAETTTLGQGYATLNGVGLLSHTGPRADVPDPGCLEEPSPPEEVPEPPEEAPEPPELPEPPEEVPAPPEEAPDAPSCEEAVATVDTTSEEILSQIPDPCETAPGAPEEAPEEAPTCEEIQSELGATIDAGLAGIEDAETLIQQPQGDVVIQSATTEPVVLALSGSVAIALAEAVAASLAASVAAAEALAVSGAAAVSVAAAIATAVAAAGAACTAIAIASPWSFAVASCAAIALAVAVALAAAAAAAAAVAASLSATVSVALAEAIALAQAKEGSAAAASSSVSLGSVAAIGEGQARATTNGLAGYASGDGDDASAITTEAEPTGMVLAVVAGNGACAASSSVSIGGITAGSLGQGLADTSAGAILADRGGDDTYELSAQAENGLVPETLVLEAEDGEDEFAGEFLCQSGAQASALTTGAIEASTDGRGNADGRAVSVFADLGGQDTYDEAGGQNNAQDVDAGAFHAAIFADVDAGVIAEDARGEVEGTAGEVVGVAEGLVGCLEGAEDPTVCLPSPPAPPAPPEELPELPDPPEDPPEPPV